MYLPILRLINPFMLVFLLQISWSQRIFGLNPQISGTKRAEIPPLGHPQQPSPNRRKLPHLGLEASAPRGKNMELPYFAAAKPMWGHFLIKLLVFGVFWAENLARTYLGF